MNRPDDVRFSLGLSRLPLRFLTGRFRTVKQVLYVVFLALVLRQSDLLTDIDGPGLYEINVRGLVVLSIDGYAFGALNQLHILAELNHFLAG